YSPQPRESRVRPPAGGGRTLAKVERRLPSLALEGLRERELVREAEPGGDLLDGEVAEPQEARGLEDHPVHDQLLRRAAGEPREQARQRPGGGAQLVRVVGGVVARGE